jgi:putative membrane protein
MRSPELPALLWRDWQPAWGLDVLAAGWSLLYLDFARRVRGWPRRRTGAFLAGVGCVVIALQSGIGAFDDQVLSDHMVQHLILLELAPLLLLAGRPGTLLVRRTPRHRRAALARGLMRLRPLTHPLVCLAVFSLVVGFTHLAFFYDATLSSPVLHEFEHGLYLVAGVFMWWPILDGDPVPGRRLSGLGRLVYVIAAMLPMTVIGAYMDRHAALIYAPYGPPAHALGISALLDQQQAGVIMWVLGTTLMVAAGLWQAMAAMSAEERRLQVGERASIKAAVADRGHER